MRSIHTFFLSILFFYTAHAQKDGLKTAEHYFNSFQYVLAAQMYEHVVNKNPGHQLASERLAVCYEKLNDPVKSEIILSSLCANAAVDARFVKMYATVLAENAKYSEAAKWYEKYASLTNDAHTKQFIQKYNTIADFYLDSTLYKIEKANFNSDQSDFSPAYYNDGIAFCSARGKGKNVYVWNNSSFIDIYWVNDSISQPVGLDKMINSSFHEGPMTFSVNFDTLFFTRNNYINSKKSNSKEGVMKLKIFYAVKKNGKWGSPQNIPLNNDEYSIGHPALSPDHRMYFVSDMPGGYGGTDIYYTKFINGNWTSPVNLGPAINSPENEMFPFINKNGDLFFSSNGHFGLGGLDIFRAVNSNQIFEMPKNMGYPINSSRDDFGFITSGEQGYFSSNRGDKTENDNIYSFSMRNYFPVVIQAVDEERKPVENFILFITTQSDTSANAEEYAAEKEYKALLKIDTEYKIRCIKDGYTQKNIVLKGTQIRDLVATKAPLQIQLNHDKIIVNADLFGNGEQLVGGVFLLTNLKTNAVNKYVVESNSAVSFELLRGTDYELTSQHTGFKTKTQTVNLSMLGSSKIWRVELTPNPTLFEKNEIGQIIELDIKYDFGKATIREDAAKELNKLVDFLNKNPTIKVELGSHTDVRGSEQENFKLSQRRAESCVQYVVKKGINSSRLMPLGYGENDLKIENAATEEEHQLNRRTTVKIVGI